MFSIIIITITIIISIPWEVISAPRKVAQKKQAHGASGQLLPPPVTGKKQGARACGYPCKVPRA